MLETPRDSHSRRSPLRQLLTASLLDHDILTRSQVSRLVSDLIGGRRDVRQFCIEHCMDPKHESPECRWGGLSVTYLIRMDVHPHRERACPIKIGRSRSATGRLGGIATSSPFPLTLLAEIPEWLLCEGELHEHFAYARMRGEWFRPVARLRRFARELAALSACTGWKQPEDDDAIA